MARSQRDKDARTYAREAMSEWGKAIRYGARALAAKRRAGATDRPPLKERLNPSRTDKGGRVGDIADIALSRFGMGGKLASKVSLGSRIVERIRGGGGEPDEESAAAAGGASRAGSDQSDASEADGLGGAAPIPVQESIDVAVPVRTAFALCTRFEEYPEFLEHVTEVEEIDESHATFIAKLRGRKRELEVELLDERPNERLDWECAEDIEHSGVISFHPLAPRLTRLELTIELEPHGVLERLARRAHLTERAIRDEMHRFKAYAELWEDAGEDEPQGSVEPEEEEPQNDAELEGEEDLVDEGDLEEEGPVDEEELEEEDFDEDEFDDEELEEEELEPAESGR